MGNDIKLPVSHRNELIKTQRALDLEKKIEMGREMDKLSIQIAVVNNHIEKLEGTLHDMNKNIEYYKNIITDMYVTLHQIENEQMNAQLSQQKYKETAAAYLESLHKFQGIPLSEATDDEYSQENIKELEKSIVDLNEQIQANNEFINNKNI